MGPRTLPHERSGIGEEDGVRVARPHVEAEGEELVVETHLVRVRVRVRVRARVRVRVRVRVRARVRVGKHEAQG